jgi:hypothetical protein
MILLPYNPLARWSDSWLVKSQPAELLTCQFPFFIPSKCKNIESYTSLFIEINPKLHLEETKNKELFSFFPIYREVCIDQHRILNTWRGKKERFIACSSIPLFYSGISLHISIQTNSRQSEEIFMEIITLETLMPWVVH